MLAPEHLQALNGLRKWAQIQGKNLQKEVCINGEKLDSESSEASRSLDPSRQPERSGEETKS